MSLFKTKDYSEPERVKNIYEDGKKQSEGNAINTIRKFFKLKQENEALKSQIIRDIRIIFEKEEK